MSDNDFFYLMEDNTIGGDDTEGHEIWVLLVDGEYWHVVWSAEDAEHFISVNNKPNAPVKLMYTGKVNPV